MILVLRKNNSNPFAARLARTRHSKRCEYKEIAPCPGSGKEDIECTTGGRSLIDSECERSRHCPPSPSVKSVSFDRQVDERLIERLDQLSSHEKDDLWYSPANFRQMQDHTRRTLCFMNANAAIPPEYQDRYCTRGLECRTRRALKKRARAREAVRAGVLNEQKMQKGESSPYDPIAIAEAASSPLSFLAQQEAQEVAVYDEFEAREYCRPGNRTKRETKEASLPLSILVPIELCRWGFEF